MHIVYIVCTLMHFFSRDFNIFSHFSYIYIYIYINYNIDHVSIFFIGTNMDFFFLNIIKKRLFKK